MTTSTVSTPPESPTTFAPPPQRRTSSRGPWLEIGLVVLVLLLGLGLTVPPGAPAHELWNTATGTATQAPSDPQTAIQLVIQKANQEQVQAVASRNPSVMSDTATAAYYRQLVQANQGLAGQGVTSIQLTRLTWGPISVNGTSASATTTETWITTSSDGTTTESTDTNVYTLVQQGGTWLIQADQHPASASAQGTPGTTAQPTPQAPLPAIPVGQNTSHNWSGYAVTGAGGYTGVTGTWNVPQPRLTGTGGVGATWVGIGGVNTKDLIQAGTQDVTAGTGQAQFEVWIEMLPAASQQVPLAVAPGDSVTVSIDEQGARTGVWQISIKNNTSGQSYQTTVNYASSESSAEWIEEAPASQGGILPLDNFNSVSFSGATATISTQTVDLAQAEAQPITMLNANAQPLAVPSSIGNDGSSFSVTRTSAPASASTGGGRGPRPAGS